MNKIGVSKKTILQLNTTAKEESMKLKEAQMEVKKLHKNITNLEKSIEEKDATIKKLEKDAKKFVDKSILQNSTIEKKTKEAKDN